MKKVEDLFKSILRDYPNISDVEENLQKANGHHVVFYRLFDDQSKIDIFYKRLKSSSAALVIVERHTQIRKETFTLNQSSSSNILLVSSDEFKELQKLFMDHFFPLDFSKLKLIGVTGTNGKTTTVTLACQLASSLKIKSLSIGTLGVCDNQNTLEETSNTTPSYIFLRKIFSKYQKKYQAFFLELSSHALDQKRFYKLGLDVAAWTNFTQDHLDYHKTMNNYLESKKLIFSHLKDRAKLFFPSRLKNEPFILDLCEEEKKKIAFTPSFDSYLFKNLPAFFQISFNQDNLELSFHLVSTLHSLISREHGQHSNQSQSEVSHFENFDLNSLLLPQGRFNVESFGEDSFVIIDYAHTPDALKNILESIKKTFPHYKITTLFGCGGDRDRSKRPLMGQIAARLSDKLILCSDNPRSEDPLCIIYDIVQGFTKNDLSYFKIIEERKEAISYALKELRSKEILLIAGKGHEKFQEIAGVKYPYSDFEVVQNFRKN